MKKEKGITLIALVITIIVLLILAGASITIALDPNNGLFTRANQASQATRVGAIKEALNTAGIERTIEKLAGGTPKTTEEIIDNMKSQGVISQQEANEAKTSKTITIGETIIDVEKELAGNTISIAAGTEVAVPEGKNWDTSKITPIADGANGIVAVPKNFYYVGGTIKTGIVISDEEVDKDKYKEQSNVGTDLTGNQFVWVPVDGTEVKYEQNTTYNTGSYSKQYQYKEYTDWTDAGGNSTSVAKYEGFYIGRYEAGIPETASFYPKEANSMTYASASEKNVSTVIPVSKKGISWSYISQSNAEIVSNNMYKNSTSVASSLVDSYAWDTVCNYIGNDKADKDSYLTNSISYGNYYDGTNAITNVTYARHTYNSGWTKATSYEKGNITQPNGSGTDRIEIETGGSETFKTKNIYDLAGNMWEWTTEKGTHGGTANTYAVLRGGSFGYLGSNDPVVFRDGGNTVGYTYLEVGFRVVLYVK